MLLVRPAKEADYLRAFGRTLPDPWFGMVAVDGLGTLLAFGTVYWDGLGRAWGGFDRLGPVSPSVMHRTAVRVMADLKAVGEPFLLTMCDEKIPGARRWLDRLGFVRVDEVIWKKDFV